MHIWSLFPLQMGCRADSFIALREKRQQRQIRKIWINNIHIHQRKNRRTESKSKFCLVSSPLLQDKQRLEGVGLRGLSCCKTPLINCQQRLRLSVHIHWLLKFANWKRSVLVVNFRGRKQQKKQGEKTREKQWNQKKTTSREWKSHSMVEVHECQGQKIRIKKKGGRKAKGWVLYVP